MLRSLKTSTAFGLVFAAAGCTAVLGISSDPHTEDTSALTDAGNKEAAATSSSGSTTSSSSSGDSGPIDAGPPTCSGTLYVRIASDFSGTATDIAVPHFWGLFDRLRQINANGGILATKDATGKTIPGCNVDIQVADNYYTAAQTLAVVNNWRTTDAYWNEVSTLFIFGTGPTTAAGPQLMTEKKVIIPGSYAGAFGTPASIAKDINYTLVASDFSTTTTSEHKASPGWPYVFYPATDYGTAIRLGIQAAWKIQPGRMAFGFDKTCAYCIDPLAAGKSFVENLEGMKIGRDVNFPQTSVDSATVSTNVSAYFDQEIAYFKAQNATTWTYDPVIWVWSGNSVFASAIVGQTVAAVQTKIDGDATIQGILTANPTKKWKIRVMANNWGIGETTSTICGPACNNDIMYGLFPVPRFGDLTNSSGMAELLATRDTWANADKANPPLQFHSTLTDGGAASPATDYTKRDPNLNKDVRYVQGYAAAVMWETAVTQAVVAGAKAPSGDDIKNALEKFNQQDLTGLTAGKVTFTTTDHRPQSNEVIYKVDNGGLLSLVDTANLALIDQWLGY
jgi:hypothetical protein